VSGNGQFAINVNPYFRSLIGHPSDLYSGSQNTARQRLCSYWASHQDMVGYVLYLLLGNSFQSDRFTAFLDGTHLFCAKRILFHD
jgi:hypothetical protein